MRKNTYSKILMAPLFMLLAVACSPNQFNQSTEYDDVYFTSSDRSNVAPSKQRPNRTAPLQSQQETAVLESYSTNQVDEQIVTKYNNGTDNVVTYYEPGPLVTTASELNYDDFVADYQNEQLAYYELPLDWNTDWNRVSFNRMVRDDFQFRLAWYDQYYRGQSFRMSQYLAGDFGNAGRRGRFGSPRVGLTVGFSNVYLGFANMAFVDLNPWGFYDPFWQPIGFGRGGWNRGWGWNRWDRVGWGWNDPFYCPPIGSAWAGGWGWRGGWNNNVFVNNNIFIDRRADRILTSNRDIRRGPRVSTSRISTVRNEVINGTAPTTRSSRYADNLGGQRSSVANSRSGRANSGRATTTNNVVSRTGRATVSNGRANQTRTSAYRFEDTGRSGRSSYVRNNGSSSRSSTSSSTRATTPRSQNSTVAGSGRSARSSRSQSSPSFNRSSSSRSYSTGRSSRSSENDSNARSRNSSSSRSAYSRGSNSRSSYSNRSSSSRSRGSSASRSSSSRSSSGSRSMSRGSSSRSSSRSSGSISRGGSSSRSSGSRSSSSRSSSSRSSSKSSGSTRSGRGN